MPRPSPPTASGPSAAKADARSAAQADARTDARTDARPAGSRRPAHAARTPGRPEAGGPALRERLLDAAVHAFARHGIAGSPLREIASGAGATPALLHYYFGGKDALLAAVIEERLMPVMGRLGEAVAAAGDDPRALVRAFVRTALEIAFAHPWLPQLWVREVLHEAGALRGFLRERIGPTLPRMLVTRFTAAQAAGRLDPRLDPRLLVPSLLGQTMFMAASAPIWREVLNADDVGVDAVVGHVLALLEAGLFAGGPHPGRPHHEAPHQDARESTDE